MKNAELYWGDILVQTCTWEEHLKTLQELFRRLAQAGMTIRPSKCTFGAASIDFPGHEDNVAKIRTAPRPTTQEAGSILYGIGRILPRFHPNFAAIAAILSDLTRKGQPSDPIRFSPVIQSYVYLILKRPLF